MSMLIREMLNFNMNNKAIFLDRDGTIACDVPYCRRPEDLSCLPTVPEAIKLFNGNGYKVVVITNQSGISRGYFTEETLAEIHNKMEDDLAEHGAHIDAIYYCPHHLEGRIERYRIACDCRKPNPGMLTRAGKELNIDLAQSFMIGDKLSDIQAGQGAGCKTIMVRTGFGAGELENNRVECDYIADDLYDAVEHILNVSRKF